MCMCKYNKSTYLLQGSEEELESACTAAALGDGAVELLSNYPVVGSQCMSYICLLLRPETTEHLMTDEP